MRLSPLALLCAAALARGDDTTHRYAEGDPVVLWANKVGPFNNPLETYEYFSLPLCPPKDAELVQKFPSLGEALQGDELTAHSNVKIRFKQDVAKTQTCTQRITADEAATLRLAVLEQYWYQFYLDDLPMWASLGKVREADDGSRLPFVYTHQHFALAHNGNRVVMANLSIANEVPISPEGGLLYFTYSVSWTPSTVPYEHRFRRYLDNQFFEHKIHWFSIFNSFMMVLFLAGLVVVILARTLSADFQRYARERDDPEDDRDFTDESGWKQVHADVFRVPAFPSLFCAIIGTGYQLCAMMFAVVLVSIWTMVYTYRGALLTYCIIAWAVTSYIAGYASGAMFARYSALSPALGPHWIQTMVYTATVFPGGCVLAVLLMNLVAWGYHSSQAIPVGTMLVMLLIWGFVSFPLVIVGTMVGRHGRRKGMEVLPRVSQIPRLIPEKQWYLRRWTFIVTGGVLPFGSIFIELYFVFTSFWNYKFYYVYGFALLVMCILLIVTMCVSVVCTYFLLNAEDHRWPWTAFLLGASTAGYMFLYAVYFFVAKTKMTGLLMTTLYFGYMALFSCGCGWTTGAVAYAAANIFVRRIYRNLKID
jgi:transmembrane 9 superfamily protein 3